GSPPDAELWRDCTDRCCTGAAFAGMTVVDHAHGTVTQLWTELLGHAPILLAETRNGAQGASDRTALQTVLEVFPRMGPSSAAWTAWVQRRTTLVSPGHGNPSAVPNGFPLPPAGTAPPPQRRTALSEPRTSAVCRRGSLRVPEGLLAVETMLGWAELLDQLAALYRYGMLTNIELSATTARLQSREGQRTTAFSVPASLYAPSTSSMSASSSSARTLTRRLAGVSRPYFSLRKRVWQYRCASAATLRSTCEFIPAPRVMPMNGRAFATLLTGTFVPAGPSWFISFSRAAMSR